VVTVQHAVVPLNPGRTGNREAWLEDALCLGTDPEAFFPEHGEQNHDAKRVCGDCPVADECLAFALAGNVGYGVWGGTTAADRYRLRRVSR